MPGITLYMQPVQDLTIDATVSRTQYQFVLENAEPADVRRTGCRSWWSGCSRSPELADVASDLQQQGLAVDLVDRPRHRRALRHHPGHGRQRAVRRLRPAHRLDHLHPVQPVPRDPGGRPGAAARRWTALNAIYLPSSPSTHRPGAALGHRQRRASRPAPLQISHLGQFPATTISFNLAPGASLGAAVDAIQQAEKRDRPAGQLRHQPSRARRAAFQASLANELLLILAAIVDDLHRAGRALRELHPPDHDPVDPALGRRRRAAGADDRRAATSTSSRSSASSC